MDSGIKVKVVPSTAVRTISDCIVPPSKFWFVKPMPVRERSVAVPSLRIELLTL